MVKYIIKRLLAGVLSLFVLVTLTFFLMHMIPGGPFSPSEQSVPGGNMGPWTDLYAFGATLYYILTNECLPNCRMRELSDTVEPLVRNARLRRLYHPRLLASIDRAIRPSIEQRYRSVDEWMADLHL